MHNILTQGTMPPDNQPRISRETLEIFAPLAHRLGISHIKTGLEDLSFLYLEPERYRMLERRVRARRVGRGSVLADSLKPLAEGLAREGLGCGEDGRSRNMSSLHRKTVRDCKNLD